MAQPSGKIPSSPKDVCPLMPGTHVPSVAIRAVDGSEVNLTEAVRERATIFVFYRGGWCPHCNRQLGELRNIEPQLNEIGFQLVCICPDRPTKLRETQEKYRFQGRLLSDSQMVAAQAFQVAYRVDAETLDGLKRHGVDLEEFSGENHHQLPVPAVFIATADGLIQFTYANPDYTVRLKPDLLLAAVKTNRR